MDEVAEIEIRLDQGEINTVKKALLYLKFEGRGEFEDGVDSEYFRECIRPYRKL
ncbi:hypothetical protein PSEEN4583 [Pseudomonas entomophila L48]|uniref:Uncharacterized protein n=1 Tax=Pseudomonas entomophila (strain L48) TaxID=384676 RepID=Q1I522_PSEE4|nr:hypothetical protein PSEEN4583 [Pseudomonas entomophila L48]